MSGIVERVARALCAADGEPENCSKHYQIQARAAIEAMREPTHEMLQSGHAVNFGYYPTQAWKAMIEEALK